MKGMDGILVVNKPAGMSSHDVISRLRKRYKQKKFGHCGTLDPMASGVLVVLAGSATRLLQFIEDTDKQYEAQMVFGGKYDTDDIWGEKTDEKPVNWDFDYEQTLTQMIGKHSMRVPDASAKKVNGKKLYEYLRAGQPVPEVRSDIEIYEIKALLAKPAAPGPLSFVIDCSSGTYVRSVCREIGEKTGNYAAMSALCRTKANGFTLAQAQDLDAAEHTLYPPVSVLALPQMQAPDVAGAKNGKHLHLDTPHERVLLMDGGQILAVYDRDHGNVFACTRGLWS